jgi:hypothetical protein
MVIAFAMPFGYTYVAVNRKERTPYIRKAPNS